MMHLCHALLFLLNCLTWNGQAGPIGWTTGRSSRIFGVSRGGSHEDDDDDAAAASYSVCSIVVWRGNQEDPKVTVNPCPPPPSLDLDPGCMLVPRDDVFDTPLWSAKGQWKDSDQHLPVIWNTLALLSDVLLVVVEVQSSDDMYPVVPNELLLSLLHGLEQRVERGLPKGRLILLLNHPAEQEELTAWRESLSVSEAVLQLNANVLDRFFISSSSSFHEALEDILVDQNDGIARILADPVAFPELLKGVFQSKIESTDSLKLEEAKGSLLPDEIREPFRVDRKFGADFDDIAAEFDAELDAELAEIAKGMKDSGVKKVDRLESSNSTEPKDDATGVELDNTGILETALRGLKNVEQQIQEGWLDPGSPPTDFARQVNPILENLQKALSTCSSAFQKEVEEQVGLRLEQLFQQHLETLRNSFGAMYETLLDQSLEKPETWTGAAERVSEGFRKAALSAIPVLARQGQAFHEMADLEYVVAFGGLLQDMADATELRKDADAELDDEGNSVEEAPLRRRRVPKWVKRVGARALIFGVNYVQGWLAWQAVRRSALERERNLPKFPLF